MRSRFHRRLCTVGVARWLVVLGLGIQGLRRVLPGARRRHLHPRGARAVHRPRLPAHLTKTHTPNKHICQAQTQKNGPTVAEQVGGACASAWRAGRGINSRPCRTARPAPAPLSSARELHKNSVAVSQLCALGRGSLTENAFGATAHVPKHGPAGWRRAGQQNKRGGREIAALHSAQGAYLAPSRPAFGFGLRSKNAQKPDFI